MKQNPNIEYLNPKQILNSNVQNSLAFSVSDLFRVSKLERLRGIS